MHPYLFETIPVYFLMWGVAAITEITTGMFIGARSGFPARRSAAVLVLVTFIILLGSKLLYLLEASVFPYDDYVPLSARGPLHGFRIPGGILLLAGALPLACRLLGLPWRRFGDLVVPMVALALVFVRFGGFFNGCCFGKASSLPWALAFPHGSWAFWYQNTYGWLPRDAALSLPMHPLQLYFAIAAAVTLVVVLLVRRRTVSPGRPQLIFYALFFTTTALLEALRANYLTLNNLIAPAASIVSVGILLGRMCAARPLPKLQRVSRPVKGRLLVRSLPPSCRRYFWLPPLAHSISSGRSAGTPTQTSHATSGSGLRRH